MSWDLYLVEPDARPCPHCGHLKSSERRGSYKVGMNYTSNTAFMLHTAAVATGWINGDTWIGEVIANARLTGAQFADRMDACFAWWRLHADAMRAQNPKNGWGDFDSYRDFLARFVALCREFPHRTVELSRW